VAEYVIRVVIDASGAKAPIANTVKEVGGVEKAAAKATSKLKATRTEAELAATSLAKMAMAARNGLQVRGTLTETLHAARLAVVGVNIPLEKTQRMAKAALAASDKGLEKQLQKNQAEAKKLANDLWKVSKAARDSLAARGGGGLDKFLRAQSNATADFLKNGPKGPSKEDRERARMIFESSQSAQDKFARRSMLQQPLGQNFLKTADAAKALSDAIQKAREQSDGLGSSIGRIAATAAAAAIMGLAAGVVSLSDEYTVLQNKLRTVTDGNDELNDKTEETFALAQRLRSEWGATAQVYGRIRRSTEELGLSEDQVMKITENLTKAIKVSGATANETKSVLLQLGQAFGSGKLNGDEFRSVMENATEVGNVLASSLGVTRGELKGLSSAGRITSEVLAKAFLSPHRVFKTFSEMVPTFAERFEMLKNAATKAIGEWAKTSPLVSALGKTIGWVSDNVEILIRAAAALGTLLTGALVAYAIPKAIIGFKALTVAMMANPWIAAATAISVLAVALAGLGKEVERFDRKKLGEIVADPGRVFEFTKPEVYEELKKVVEEASAASARMAESFKEIAEDIRHANSLMGQMATKVNAAAAAVDVVKSIQKVSRDTAPALIDAVTTSTLKMIDNLVEKAKKAQQAFDALKKELEQLATAADPMVGQVLEWNKAEETLGRALRAKLITLQEQKKILDATYDRIFNAPVTAAAGSGATFAGYGELAKTAVAREELLLQMGEEQRAQERAAEIYERMPGVLRDYAEAVTAANDAFAQGRINFDDYTSAVEEAELALLGAEKGTKSLEYGIASGFDRLKDQATDVAGAMEAAFTNAYAGIENAIVDLVVTGKTDFKGLVDSMLADLTRVLVRLAFTKLLQGDYAGAALAGGAVGAGGLVSALGGLRTGGQFKVGGSGGPDSQVVAFRASPNETVSVTTPNQNAKGNFGGGQPVINIFNVQDQREVSALDTPAGARAINNVMRKNPQIIRSRNR
jgi:tape measure domain-containing protein